MDHLYEFKFLEDFLLVYSLILEESEIPIRNATYFFAQSFTLGRL